MRKVKLVSTFSQPSEIIGVFYTEQESSTGGEVFLTWSSTIRCDSGRYGASDMNYLGNVSRFYFVINTNQRKLHKARKISNLLNLNINISKKKQPNKLVKSSNIKYEVEILLQRNTNSISNGCDSTKWAQTPYFHCAHSIQNKYES